MTATLTYYIFEGLLIGKAGGRSFHISALSGGGGGSKKGGIDPERVNNPYRTGDKTKDGKAHQHGGPLPIGRYTIHKPAQHKHLGLAAYLEPSVDSNMLGRAGFYIHGRGQHGSDGCVVPMESFQPLMAALTSDGGGTLHVFETAEGPEVRFA